MSFALATLGDKKMEAFILFLHEKVSEASVVATIATSMSLKFPSLLFPQQT